MSVRVDPRIGTELAGYRIERLLGRGGMSVVYLAHDLRLKRRVALKLLAPELAEDARFRERFLRESELAASLDHQNVIPIYEAGETGGLLYIAMRYVEGTDLKELLYREGALEPAQAVSLLAQVAGALDAAHDRGLVHRDVKPGNVLIARDGHAYLSDFGLTKQAGSESGVTETGQFVGTPDYIAPELIERAAYDHRVDVYSLGCLLYQCLVGESPFRSDSLMGVLWAHVNTPPASAHRQRPELPEAIDAVIVKAMAKDPDRRYPTCAALLGDARSALGLSGELTQPSTAGTAARRRVWLLAAALLVALVAAAVVAALLLTGGKSGPSVKPTIAIAVDSLQRIDPGTNSLVATIAGLRSPSAVSAGEGAVWVANREGSTLSRFDPRTNAEVGSIPTAFGARNVLAAGGAVWVLGDAFDLSRLDPGDGRVLQRLSVHETGGPLALAYGAGALFGAIICPCGQPNWEGADQAGVVRVPYRTEAVVTTGIERSELPTLKPTGIAVGNGSVWVASDEIVLSELVRLGTSSISQVTDRIRIEGGASSVAYGEGGVWVTNPYSDTVSRIDPVRNRVVDRVSVGDDPVAVSVGAGSVWVANYRDGTVSRIDPATAKVVATIPVGPQPNHIAVGEGSVWVTVNV